ncbi:MAG: TIGR04141 family sporadically distributed protein [Flavobacteriales bacterium]|nr:TIGR04141 family sporadically distributed protein [Flavobacteriales bacterium]
MDYSVTRHIKVYQIDTLFYEIRDYSEHSKVIQHIVDKHRKATNREDSCGKPVNNIKIDNTDYFIYTFNQDEVESAWTAFLPQEIINPDDFTIQTVSFVLFSSVNNTLFAIIGGSGMQVIKRYLNHTFGIDLFERIADPANDIVYSIDSRGITGNLSLTKETYRNEQRLIDSLQFGRIPVHMRLLLRDVLVADVFDFLAVEDMTKVVAEVCSSFFIKHRMTFDETHALLQRLDEILQIQQPKPLSLFVRERDVGLIENNHRLGLYSRLRDDMMLKIPPGSDPNAKGLDYDFTHPSKWDEFYECDTYRLFARNAEIPFHTSGDRHGLYRAALQYIYENIEENTPYNFKAIISGIRVYGYRNGAQCTHAMFTQHLSCELEFGSRPLFLLDDKWYRVKGDFVETLTDECKAMIRAHGIPELCVNIPWPHGNLDEEAYNAQYSAQPGFMVFDRKLSQNIELCDLLYEDEYNIYLIHVKKGFNAKIRDLSNQILISSQRLWSDLKSGSFEFLRGTLLRYNQGRSEPVLEESFYAKFKAKKIVYVMAFSSDRRDGKSIFHNLDSIQSNIAKFSLVQSVREMNSKNYPLKVFEIPSA